MRKIFSILLRIGISSLLLFILFRRINMQDILRIISAVNPYLLIAAFLIIVFNFVLCFFRWWMLLKAANVHLKKGRAAVSHCAGLFFNLLLPSTIGGDFIRSLDLGAHTRKLREVTAAVLLDRLSGFVGLVTVAFLGVILGYKLVENKTILLGVGSIATILGLLLVVLFNNAIYSKVNRFLEKRPNRILAVLRALHHEIYIFRDRRGVLFGNLIFSLIVQLTMPLGCYVIFLALGVNINPIYLLIFIPLINVITFLPISIGGLGLRDISTVTLFGTIGVSKDLSLTMSLLIFFFIFLIGIAGGVVYFWRKISLSF
jgi:hypothetical protein